MKRRDFLITATAATTLGLTSTTLGQTGLTVEMVHTDPFNPVLGNPDGDVTIVEFFDYQCPWCKKGYPDLMKTINDDGNVRLLMRDWPIFGESSIHASRLVLATDREQYAPTLETLFATEGRLTIDQVNDMLSHAGHDIADLKSRYRDRAAEVDGLIGRNMAIAQAFGFSGTPSFVIGTQVFFGYLDEQTLRDAIEQARA